MLFSIILLLAACIMLLDSIGGKVVRSRIIKKGDVLFAAAMSKETASTIRLKAKGATKKTSQKRWTPIEAKYFLTHDPLGFLAYEDWTHAFLISRKKYESLSTQVTDSQSRNRILSLFSVNPKASIEEMMVHYLTFAPWYAEVLKTEHCQVERTDKQILVDFQLEEHRVHGTFQLGKKGQIRRFTVKLEDSEPLKTGIVTMDYQYDQYQDFENRKVPFSFKRTYSYEDKRASRVEQFEITDIVEGEAFKWW